MCSQTSLIFRKRKEFTCAHREIRVAGRFVYTPGSGTVLAAGTHTLSVTRTLTDTIDYKTATKTVTLTVNKSRSL